MQVMHCEVFAHNLYVGSRNSLASLFLTIVKVKNAIVFRLLYLAYSDSFKVEVFLRIVKGKYTWL